MSVRSRNWLVTCNVYTDVDVAHLKELAQDISVQYLVFGYELAPTTGHKHLQGMVVFRHARKFVGVQKFFKGLSHANLKKGDRKAYEMMMYCKKDGDFWEHGIPPQCLKASGAKGAKSRSVNYAKLIKYAENGDLDKIKKKAPGLFVRHQASFKAIAKDSSVMPPDLANVCGVWIYGPAGSGKSHYAREAFSSYYDKACNKWWCNYKGEDNVLLDDFDITHARLAHHLKRWADKYAFSVEIKGGGMNIRPKHVVVTSQYRIGDIWSDEATRDALNRRFIKIKIHIDSQGNRVIQEQGF
ncbi:replication-associated protein [Crucivirus-373]|nr:replication-associated protein [Crucivirus-373]